MPIKAVMCHGFHTNDDKLYPKLPGSVNIRDFNAILGHYKFVSVSPAILNKMASPRNKDSENQYILTFDDGLISQKLVLPILAKAKLRALFFLCSIPVAVMRYNYIIGQIGLKKFYQMFFERTEYKVPEAPDDFLAQFPFYSKDDRKYRYYRDYLNPVDYNLIMMELERGIKIPEMHLIPKDVVGHEIGLHSHTHPRNMYGMNPDQQFSELISNWSALNQYNGHDIYTMSYPMGRYDGSTIKIAEIIGIKYAFRSDNLAGRTNMELPRIDINELLKT